MGLTDYLSDLFFPTVYADAPEEDDDHKDQGGEDDSSDEGKQEGGDDKEGVEDGAAGEDGGDDEGGDEGGEDGEEEEEEEEEDEPVDPKPKLEEECARSHGCIGYKHHYDECVERVTAQQEEPSHKGHKEDCVEEFFHLQHCATQCAAPKLFKQLR